MGLISPVMPPRMAWQAASDHPRLGRSGKGTVLSLADVIRAFVPGSVDAGVIRAYARSLRRHGATPEGVFWNSQKSQRARFAAILAMVRRDLAARGKGGAAPTIADIGCGYGAMFDFLRARPDFSGWEYRGVDISAAMVRECRLRHPAETSRFAVGRTPPLTVDYAVFSGTFNLCMISDNDRWERYILDSLAGCWPRCRRGMVLNLLCRRQTGVTNNIYYADRARIMDGLRTLGQVTAVDTPAVKHDVTFLVTRS